MVRKAMFVAAALVLAPAAHAQGYLGPQPLFGGTGAPVKPFGNPGEWITYADYPPEARAARQTGVVGFVLEVDASGMVDSCKVTKSSGHASLDKATCALMRRRARFLPARITGDEERGATVWRSSVEWTLPPAPSPNAI